MYETRHAGPDDFRWVLDIDFKSFHEPWIPAEWQSPDLSVGIATCTSTPIGFSAFVLREKKGVKFADLYKIAVKREHRRKGLATQLLNDIVKCAGFTGARYIQTVVPEHLCVPDTVIDVTPWLAATGFKAVGVSGKTFKYCGEKEDGFIFRLEIK
jgi:GNAT superfamily N-acetyltransferase